MLMKDGQRSARIVAKGPLWSYDCVLKQNEGATPGNGKNVLQVCFCLTAAASALRNMKDMF